MMVGGADITTCFLFNTVLGNVDVLAYVTGLEISLDMDRTPYVAATLVLEGVSATPSVIDACDPRRTSGTYLRAAWTINGISYPQNSVGTPFNTLLYVQTAVYDALADTVTLTCTGSESRMLDKRRIAITALTVSAAATFTVYDLCWYSINDVFGGGSVTDISTGSSTAIPTGDRRLMQPGESHWDLQEPELNAANARLYADLVGGFWITNLTAAPGNPDRLASATCSALTLDRDFAVSSVRKTMTRQGDFADGVLVKAAYLNGSGTQVTAYQASGSGVNTKGVVVERDRALSPGLANQIASRTVNRGSSYEVIGSIHCGVQPGINLTLIRAAGSTALGMIRAVNWNFTDDVMTVSTQIGQPT